MAYFDIGRSGSGWLAARGTIAHALIEGDEAALAEAASGILKPLRCNFVERPWGGMRMREYKGVCALPDQPRVTGMGLGEAFEIAAFDADDEARAHPSRVRFADGSELALPALLRRHAARFLGPALADAHGGAFPLLPKTLDVRELLSVQGHPEGHTEAYVIIDADPGATLRVGFSRDIDPQAFEADLRQGRARQQRLLELVGEAIDPVHLQRLLAPWLADREASHADLPDALRDALLHRGQDDSLGLLDQLKSVYWQVLDSMNAIPVVPGMVVHNANPSRIVAASGRAASAEVHALGNPEGREVLALEIRRPGPTFRAWDNVRFPLRRIDIGAAVRVLNLKRVAPDELIAHPEAIGAGRFRSVRDSSFEIEHLRPAHGTAVEVPPQDVHCLHCIAGRVELEGSRGCRLGSLERGESALVPVGVGAYQVRAAAERVEVIKVNLSTVQ